MSVIKKTHMDPVSPDVLKKKQRNKKKSLLLAAELVLEQGTHLDPVTRDGTKKIVPHIKR